MSHKIIIADNYAVFRAGTARFIAVEDEFVIVGQCDDLPRLKNAIDAHAKATAIFASSLDPDLPRLARQAAENEVRLVAVLERGASSKQFVQERIPGILYRDMTRDILLKCLRTVARGGTFVQEPTAVTPLPFETDVVGERARNRLSPKELQIVGLIVQGYKNREIALALNNSEQVIKNYLRSIFDKTGVSDRLELALFTIHHRILLDAVEGNAPGTLEGGKGAA